MISFWKAAVFFYYRYWVSEWEYSQWDTISIPKNKVVLSDKNASLVRAYTKTFETQFNKYSSNYWNEIHNFAFTSSRSFQKMFYLFSNTFLNFPQTTVFFFFFLHFSSLSLRLQSDNFFISTTRKWSIMFTFAYSAFIQTMTKYAKHSKEFSSKPFNTITDSYSRHLLILTPYSIYTTIV